MATNIRQIDQLKAGSIISYLQMALNVFIGLVYTPVMIRLLGKSEYGLYSTVSSTVMMLSVLNLGFSSGYIRYFAKYKAEKKQIKIDQLNGLFLVIFSIIGCIALLCGLVLTYHLDWVFDTGLTIEEYRIARTLMLLLTINMAISFPMSVFYTIITAHEHFVVLKMLGIIKTVLSPLLTMPLLLWGYRSVAMVVVTIAVSFTSDIICFLYARKRLNQRVVFKQCEQGILKALFAFCFFIALNLIIDQINWNVDKVLLGRYRGTTSVAIYSVGFQLYQYYMLISTSVSGMFVPRIHRIYHTYKEDQAIMNQEYTSLFIKVGRIQFMILMLIASGLVLVGKEFIHLWAGDGFDESYTVALLLTLPASIALIQNLGIEIQRAQNKHQFRSIVYVAMALINLGLSIWLCQLYGASGAAMGTAISLLCANGIVMNVYYHKVCNINVVAFWQSISHVSVSVIIPFGLGILLRQWIDCQTWLSLGCYVLCYTILYSASMWFTGMNKFEKDLISKMIKRVTVFIQREGRSKIG